MTIGGFPVDPSARRAILVLDTTDIQRSTFERDGTALLQANELYVLDSSIAAHDSVLRQLANRGLIRPGTMLIQSPFDAAHYEEIGDATRVFALQKHMHLSNLCRLLGAGDVKVLQVEFRLGSES